ALAPPRLGRQWPLFPEQWPDLAGLGRSVGAAAGRPIGRRSASHRIGLVGLCRLPVLAGLPANAAAAHGVGSLAPRRRMGHRQWGAVGAPWNALDGRGTLDNRGASVTGCWLGPAPGHRAHSTSDERGMT